MDKIICPNCKHEMAKIDTNMLESFSEGSGWGCEFIYVCLNDRCKIFVEGWEWIANYYGAKASYRCIMVPGEKSFSTTIVFSPDAFKGLVITEKTERRNKKALIKGRLKYVLRSAMDEMLDDLFGIEEQELDRWRRKLDKKIKSVIKGAL